MVFVKASVSFHHDVVLYGVLVYGIEVEELPLLFTVPARVANQVEGCT